MAVVLFNEGALILADSGWPANVEAALSTKPCSGVGCHVAGDTYAGGFGEDAGTGYARDSNAEPTATGAGAKAWPVFTFATGAATDWSNAIKSIVFIDPATSKLIAAKDLSTTRDMSAANTTLNYTLTTATTGA